MGRGPIEAATWRDLPADQRRSGLGVAALVTARRMDAGDPDDRDFATLHRELRTTLLELAKARPPAAKTEDDSLAKRRARRAAARGAAG